MTTIPDSHTDLLTRPLYAHLATIRPDGSPQANPMWFSWDGQHLLFTTSTTRQKYRNVSGDPRVAISVNDPDQPYRYLEVRGVVERIEPDPTGSEFAALADRYGLPLDGPPGDVGHRVVLVVTPTATSHQ
ncbi:TIGR03618 family F420-dependent PPOX class oxidoreductase [Gordonia amarae]|uniref:Pyridoxamine 5'-phosphate oxidase N-terminal domain-containing protein n=2 Tax=Gordonia amarae TaxID=36821 RepID=G7GUI4_9ACTN|nr:PPOX class F420-dependent oxidoreductase [Gordonia amarae]MCS3877395.1 PPOX class probable F420-dependent enzyme [Gordonia amarae]QHN16143.1 TIGR03618 family F420-dependent PPOX class oxidoreductase [Gordonia amarae]QHN20711.1 TIGR03618 family F420-dependent PPOX class oxidoreductase [Gordonia amarae]QHN29563.1 TIGR03618 family F420-dependent PPOX class oxidoreductase [Gordonia amarae]QHN38339.1 TIGR03618 family F420-dependent PPOX class oxidoreductase [Gordonia amarae]